MPLFTRDGRAALYVHVPKTGGSSVGALFRANGFAVHLFDADAPGSLNVYRHCPPQHMHATQLLAVLRPRRCELVFMTVREPLARAVSEYRMRARGRADIPPFAEWFRQQFECFARNPFAQQNHIRPQSEFRLPGCDVFRQEDGFGEAMLRRIEAKLGTTLAQRRVPFAGKRGDEVVVPSEEIERARPLVEAFYAADYVAFGYARGAVARAW